MTTRIQAAVDVLHQIGCRVLTPGEVERIRSSGLMLDRWAADCFPPPNAQGQQHFGKVMMDSAAQAILSAFYPIVELCTHEFDEQAGCCRRCGAHTEEFTFADKEPSESGPP